MLIVLKTLAWRCHVSMETSHEAKLRCIVGVLRERPNYGNLYKIDYKR